MSHSVLVDKHSLPWSPLLWHFVAMNGQKDGSPPYATVSVAGVGGVVAQVSHCENNVIFGTLLLPLKGVFPCLIRFRGLLVVIFIIAKWNSWIPHSMPPNT